MISVSISSEAAPVLRVTVRPPAVWRLSQSVGPPSCVTVSRSNTLLLSVPRSQSVCPLTVPWNSMKTGSLFVLLGTANVLCLVTGNIDYNSKFSFIFYSKISENVWRSKYGAIVAWLWRLPDPPPQQCPQHLLALDRRGQSPREERWQLHCQRWLWWPKSWQGQGPSLRTLRAVPSTEWTMDMTRLARQRTALCTNWRKTSGPVCWDSDSSIQIGNEICFKICLERKSFAF